MITPGGLDEPARPNALKDAGYSYAAIAAETGRDWRTVKKYIEAEPGRPPAYESQPPRRKLIDRFTQACSTSGLEPRSRS